MKNYVLENDPTIDGIPERLKRILRSRFTENRQYWFSFSDKFKREPKVATAMLGSIESGSNLIGQTNFHEEDQIETFVIGVMALLMRRGVKANFYIVLEQEVFGTIEEAFGKYLTRNEAYHTPEKVNPREYKEMLNDTLMTVLDYHKLYSMVSANAEEDVQVLYENCLASINVASIL